VAVAVDAAGGLDGQDAEVVDELPGGADGVDVGDEGGEDGGRHVAEAGDGVEAVRFRQLAVRRNQQVFQAFLPGGAVAELADLVADEFFSQRAVERTDRVAGVGQ
jgi:hypothetical protein